MNAIFLDQDFDASSLTDGLYLTDSYQPAYDHVMALANTGNAEFLGERYIEGGHKAVLIGIGNYKRMARNAKGQIGIDVRMFVTALRDYENWREKWWREVIQNSVDGGADRIDCSVEKTADGNYVVSCQDNGTGMDEDTLLNKFLMLGGSGKAGSESTAGGFGKAKELILLPWLQWRVVTQGRQVIGVGINYEVSEWKEQHTGTLIEVVMPEDTHTEASHLLAYIEKSYLPKIKFTLNGSDKNESTGNPIRAMLKAPKLVHSVGDKFDIFYRPLKKGDQASPRCLVRTREGLHMFERSLPDAVHGLIIVELKQKSTDLLTANRDGFRDYETKRGLEDFLNKLAADTKSALSEKKGLIREKFKGKGKFSSDPREKESMLALSISKNFVGGALKVTDEELVTLESIIKGDAHGNEGMQINLGAEALRVLLETKINGQSHLEAIMAQLVWQPDFYLMNEIEGFRVPSRFYPDRMTASVLRLAKVWTEMCRYVLIQLGSRSKYGIGFIFSGDTLAAYKEDEEDRDAHWLMLNPIKGDDKKDYQALYSPNDEGDLQILYALAVHECTHLADGISYHEESFATALTKNMAITAGGYRKIRKIAQAIKLRGQAELAKPIEEAKVPAAPVASAPTSSYKYFLYDGTIRGVPSSEPMQSRIDGHPVLSRLPSNLYVVGDVDLSETSINSLPDGLTIEGNLFLNASLIEKLPEDLLVTGDLKMSGAKYFHQFPESFPFIGGSINLSESGILNLPNNNVIAGDLSLEDVKNMAFLPDGLVVGGSLDLRNSPIEGLPRSGLYVGRKVRLASGELFRLTDSLTVEEIENAKALIRAQQQMVRDELNRRRELLETLGVLEIKFEF